MQWKTLILCRFAAFFVAKSGDKTIYIKHLYYVFSWFARASLTCANSCGSWYDTLIFTLILTYSFMNKNPVCNGEDHFQTFVTLDMIDHLMNHLFIFRIRCHFTSPFILPPRFCYWRNLHQGGQFFVLSCPGSIGSTPGRRSLFDLVPCRPVQMRQHSSTGRHEFTTSLPTRPRSDRDSWPLQRAHFSCIHPSACSILHQTYSWSQTRYLQRP